MTYEKLGFESTQKKIIEECKINVKDVFGFMPKSVYKFMKIKKYEDIIGDKDYDKRNVGDLGQAKRRGGGFASTLNYSIFNSGLADFICKYYFEKKFTILDPFMGRATRPIMANINELNYIGFDVDDEICEWVRQKVNSLKEKNIIDKEIKTEINCADGVTMEKYVNEEDVFDGIFTCPPYWNTEQYSGKGNDLSHLKTYDRFLEQIEICLRNCFRLIKWSNFKNNKYYLVVFVVGSLRQGVQGVFDLDYDFQRIARKIGFKLHDKIIHENIPTTLCFAVRRNYTKKIVGKCHETVLIFRKGG